MHFTGKDILSMNEFSLRDIHTVLDAAQTMDEALANNSKTFSNVLSGKIMATLFFEPSTRTRLSFESAVKRLGGSAIGFTDWETTSLTKGEDLTDTVRVVGDYADVIVIRHPQIGSATLAAEATDTPVINGGDGSNEHPTQTFLDLYTIRKTKKRLHNLNIGFVGDLKYGRTVHSLIRALDKFRGNSFFLISPESLALPEENKKKLQRPCLVYEDIQTCIDQLDIIYVTRIQRERFPNENLFKQVAGSYQLTKQMVLEGKKDVKIMHPLPRVGEIKHDLDATAHAVYFQQARNGLPVRMALLKLILC